MIKEFILVFQAEELSSFHEDFLVFGFKHLLSDLDAVFIVI